MSIWHRIALDKKHKKLSGVCSGIAGALGYSRLVVRLVTLMAVFIAPVITLTVYTQASWKCGISECV